MFPVKEKLIYDFSEVNNDVFCTKAKFRFINGIGYALVDTFSLCVQPVGLFVALVLFVKGNISSSQAILISNTMGIMGKGTKEFNAFLQYIQTVNNPVSMSQLSGDRKP